MKRFVLVLLFGLAAGAQASAQDPSAQDPSAQDPSAARSAFRPTILAQASGTPEICSEIYQPVCGTSPSGMRTTYPNACFARAAKATNVTPGECSK
jgi:hypothetical protein